MGQDHGYFFSFPSSLKRKKNFNKFMMFFFQSVIQLLVFLLINFFFIFYGSCLALFLDSSSTVLHVDVSPI